VARRWTSTVGAGRNSSSSIGDGSGTLDSRQNPRSDGSSPAIACPTRGRLGAPGGPGVTRRFGGFAWSERYGTRFQRHIVGRPGISSPPSDTADGPRFTGPIVHFRTPLSVPASPCPTHVPLGVLCGVLVMSHSAPVPSGPAGLESHMARLRKRRRADRGVSCQVRWVLGGGATGQGRTEAAVGASAFPESCHV
jgi:hypothetical protein